MSSVVYVAWQGAEVKASAALIFGTFCAFLALAFSPKILFPFENEWASAAWFLFNISAWLFSCRMAACGGPAVPLKNLTGKVAIVTGAITGIGFETCKELAKMGATVVLAGRGIKRLEEAKRKMVEQGKGKIDADKLDYMHLDLADLKTVKAFAAEFRSKYSKLDLLINNAGVMACPYSKTKDGFDMQFGTNHLGHFVLTNLLIDLLEKGDKARVVNLSSVGHVAAQKGIDLDSISDPNKYNPMLAYGISKLANILFTFELQRRLTARKSSVTTYSAHPGAIVATDLARHMSSLGGAARAFINTGSLLVAKTLFEGCQTSIFCAIDENAVPGHYHCDARRVDCTKQGADPKAAKDLWKMSVKMTKDIVGHLGPLTDTQLVS